MSFASDNHECQCSILVQFRLRSKLSHNVASQNSETIQSVGKDVNDSTEGFPFTSFSGEPAGGARVSPYLNS